MGSSESDKPKAEAYLATFPAECEAEFQRLVRLTNNKAMNQRQTVQLILDLDQSQKLKARCGNRIMNNLRRFAGQRG